MSVMGWNCAVCGDGPYSVFSNPETQYTCSDCGEYFCSDCVGFDGLTKSRCIDCN